MSTECRVLVAGIGNIFLGDDGFGPEVLRRVDVGSLPSGVRAVDFGIRGVHLAYELLDGWDGLVLVDALPNRGAPGAVRVFEIDAGDAARDGGFDAHGMDPAAVFASLDALGGTAPRTIVVGAQVRCVDERIGLSAEVAASLDEAVNAVRRTVTELVATTPPRAPAATAPPGKEG
ncbi:hydrogenase maturation protease [Rhodococcus sp. NPDC127528]|uniref:hydrogenase maturation protease n=1 Tax=unclassified Rhodococcus (in: high G+C Gram-positive bacteria) TaxID=192944 RepID=UPI00364405CC